MYEEDFIYTEELYDAGLECDEYHKPVGKVYYRWKDTNDHTWIEMTGKEYYDFVNSEEGAKHFFVEEIDPYLEADTIVHEATEAEFRKWKSEKVQYFQLRADMRAQADGISTEDKNHRRKMPMVYSVVSFNQTFENDDDDAPTSLEEIVADPDSLFEDELLMKISIAKAIEILLPEEKEVIFSFFFDNPQELGEREISKKIGVPLMTFNDRKNRALKKIKKFLKLPVQNP